VRVMGPFVLSNRRSGKLSCFDGWASGTLLRTKAAMQVSIRRGVSLAWACEGVRVIVLIDVGFQVGYEASG
jgi:hypothetical protein